MSEERDLRKQKKVQAEVTITPVPVQDVNIVQSIPLDVNVLTIPEVEIKNDVDNPIPVSISTSVPLDVVLDEPIDVIVIGIPEVEIKNDSGNPVVVSEASSRYVVLNSEVVTASGAEAAPDIFGDLKEINVIFSVTTSVTGAGATLTFTLWDCDPLTGNLLAPIAVSDPITTPIVNQLIKGKTLTGAVQLNWEVTGTTPVFTGVNATIVGLQNRDVNVDKIGDNDISVDVGTSDIGTQRVVLASDQVLPLPTGAATAANQTSQIALATALNGFVDGIEALLTTLNGKDFATQTTLAAISGFVDGLETLTGALTETAPATDTASSGLNGRLQRVAQRLTSLITVMGSPFQAGGSIGNTTFGATQSGAWTVTANAGTNLNTSALALETTQSTQNTRIGDLTEAAPASDTASSGLNGRLQRIAQRITSLIALMPASLGQKTMANSFAVVIASDQAAIPVTASAGTNLNTSALALETTQSTQNTRIGDLTETAPASDTASSGLNGRLQRIAQRLTSLIALVPAALVGGRFDINLGSWLGSTAPTVGQKTMANSIPVALASDQTVSVGTGEKSTTATVSAVTAGTSVVTLLAANANRKALIIFNDSGRNIYIKFGTAASATDFTIRMADNSVYELPLPIYTGILTVITAAGSGPVRITEQT